MSEDNSAARINEITTATSAIVSAYLSRNPATPDEVTSLISSVSKALGGVSSSGPSLHIVPNGDAPVPAVPIEKSVTPDYIVCLEDGKHLKMLKRHLTTLGFTPETYREKWGLPDDYPLVAPNHSLKRSTIAIDTGFGHATRLKAVS